MYPFLNPALFYPTAIGGGEVDTTSTIANARARSMRQDIIGYSPTQGAEIDITPDTLISTLQSEIEKQFGIRCHINCRPWGLRLRKDYPQKTRFKKTKQLELRADSYQKAKPKRRANINSAD